MYRCELVTINRQKWPTKRILKWVGIGALWAFVIKVAIDVIPNVIEFQKNEAIINSANFIVSLLH
jgi:hypothetical protein